MILGTCSFDNATLTCPHTRGDDPKGKVWTVDSEPLVPIRVGMIPSWRRVCHRKNACPHTRGDDPEGEVYEVAPETLSPYAWG